MFIFFSFFTMVAQMNINKVVIPAAGKGSRFYPWTYSVPKELLPLGNVPAIEYVVREALAAGCSDMVMISGARKNALNDYFEKADLPANFSYIPQVNPKGTGHAIALAETVIKEDFFGVVYPDDLFIGDNPGIGQLIEIAKKENASVVGVIEVPWEDVSSYGVVKVTKKITDDLFEIDGVIEKPKKDEAPSNLVMPGRYVFSSRIFKHLKNLKPSARGELELTDAITELAKNERVLAYKIKGRRYDVGTPENWLKANVALALDSEKYRDSLISFFKEELSRSR
jgi:UTP--glucose-1-phosphate uridylyltransferase